MHQLLLDRAAAKIGSFGDGKNELHLPPPSASRLISLPQANNMASWATCLAELWATQKSKPRARPMTDGGVGADRLLSRKAERHSANIFSEEGPRQELDETRPA